MYHRCENILLEIELCVDQINIPSCITNSLWSRSIWIKNKPILVVPRRYWDICLTPFQCLWVGEELYLAFRLTENAITGHLLLARSISALITLRYGTSGSTSFLYPLDAERIILHINRPNKLGYLMDVQTEMKPFFFFCKAFHFKSFLYVIGSSLGVRVMFKIYSNYSKLRARFLYKTYGKIGSFL